MCPWLSKLYLLGLLPILILVTSCHSTPTRESTDEIFRHQVLFTVPGDLQMSHKTTRSLQAVERSEDSRQPEQQRLVTHIIKLHKLKKVAQWSVKALGVEAIVAEFRTGRKIEEVLQALEADGRVESFQRVNTYELLSYNDPYFYLQKTVSEPDLASVHHSVTGRNVSVGIVDTRVDRQHPELAARIVYSNNFVSHDQEDFDTDEHGTAVAGVVGSAANNELGIVGVALEANLMIFKACAQNDLMRRVS